jgi:hypothetical protein
LKTKARRGVCRLLYNFSKDIKLDGGSAIKVIFKKGTDFCPSHRFIKSDFESLKRMHQECQKENKLSRFAELECRASSIKEFQKVLKRQVTQTIHCLAASRVDLSETIQVVCGI